MSYSENLAIRIRQRFENLPNVIEKEMMGGLTFMYNDKMCVGGENIFISDNHDEWVQIISNCFCDLELVKSISAQARNFSGTEYDYKMAAKKLVDYLFN
jgi:hypothetical protein